MLDFLCLFSSLLYFRMGEPILRFGDAENSSVNTTLMTPLLPLFSDSDSVANLPLAIEIGRIYSKRVYQTNCIGYHWFYVE